MFFFISLRKNWILYWPIYVKCWANVMRKGDQIKCHKHAEQYKYNEEDYLCGHISIKVDGTTST